MSAATDFFLNSRASVVQLELLEMSHPNFSKVHRIVRNATRGVRAPSAVQDYVLLDQTAAGAGGGPLSFEVAPPGTPGVIGDAVGQKMFAKVEQIHTEGGVTIVIATLNPGDPIQVVNPDGSQIEPLSWEPNQYLLLERQEPSYKFVLLGVFDTPGSFFDYYPLRISRSSSSDSLEQGLRVDLGDLGQVWPQELDAVSAADGFGTKPIVRYVTYRSDDLVEPIFGPVELEASNLSFKREGVSFEAHAPKLNSFSTGSLYTFDRFPMLRGFL